MQSTGLSPIAGRPSKYIRHEDSIRFCAEVIQARLIIPNPTIILASSIFGP